MSNSEILHVTDNDFNSVVLESALPVLVDYWAEWCAPCKMIAPVLEELAGDYAGRLQVCKLDVEANPSSPGKYGVRGIPTLIMFKDGERIGTKVGALSKKQLIQFIDENI